MKYIKLFESFVNEADKFTFKTTKPTGRYRSFDSDYHDIKFKGVVVGSIVSSKPFKCRFMVIKNGTTIKDDNPNCPWKWITLKKESETLQDAKDWLNANIEGIMKQWPLRTSE